MTVAELIAKLQTFQPHGIVEVDFDGVEGSRRLTSALEVGSSALLVGDGSYEAEHEDGDEF